MDFLVMQFDCFVDFDDDATVDAAIKLHNKEVHGQAVTLKYNIPREKGEKGEKVMARGKARARARARAVMRPRPKPRTRAAFRSSPGTSRPSMMKIATDAYPQD